jgi:hypothetical protein
LAGPANHGVDPQKGKTMIAGWLYILLVLGSVSPSMPNQGDLYGPGGFLEKTRIESGAPVPGPSEDLKSERVQDPES